jgi:hypothetical protein
MKEFQICVDFVKCARFDLPVPDLLIWLSPIRTVAGKKMHLREINSFENWKASQGEKDVSGMGQSHVLDIKLRWATRSREVLLLTGRLLPVACTLWGGLSENTKPPNYTEIKDL